MPKMDYKEQVVHLCGKLAEIPSPPFKEKEIAILFEKMMTDLGFEKVWRDRLGNVIGEMALSREEGPNVLLASNLDSSLCLEEPYDTRFKPKIKGKKITGCGVAENKGSLAASALAAVAIKEELSKEVKGKVIVAGISAGSFFAPLAAQELFEQTKPNYVIVGGPTGLKVCIGQRGRAEIIVENHGKCAPLAAFKKGVNALGKMLPVLLTIEKEFLSHEDPTLGEGCLEIIDIKASSSGPLWSVPDRCVAVFDRRVLPGENKEEVLNEVRMIADGVAAFDLDLDVSVSIKKEYITTYTGTKASVEIFEPAWVWEKKEKFLASCMDALNKKGIVVETVLDTPIVSGSYYAAVKGVPTIVFGPGDLMKRENGEEFVEVDELVTAFEGYKALIRAFLNRP